MPIALSDALASLQGRLQSPYGAHWSQVEGVFALTEALRVWQALTGQIVGDVEVPVASGTVWQLAPRQLLSVQHVAIDGRPLVQYSVDELDREYGDWEAATGTVRRWAPNGASLIALHPAPTTNVVLTLTGVKDIPLLADGDELDVGNEELTRLLGYAHSPYLTFKDGPGEFETDTMSLLVRAAGERNSELRKSNFYKAYAGRDRTMAGGQEGSMALGEKSLGVRQ